MPSHRDGADVTFNDIKKLFGFRRITIGRWVNADEQQIAANLFFDALYDLADILQVPEQVISLSGTLSLAFGSGGSKHASAHYNSGKRELALAKNAGAGALAHEWFHAFDHYICPKLFSDTSELAFASQAWLDNATPIYHPLNDRLDVLFETLFLDQHSQPNDYVKTAVKADKVLNTYYFAMPQEMAARAFEACIQDHRIKNSFLVSGTKMSAEAKVGVYPLSHFRQQISELVLSYFVTLGQAMTHKSKQ